MDTSDISLHNYSHWQFISRETATLDIVAGTATIGVMETPTTTYEGGDMIAIPADFDSLTMKLTIPEEYYFRTGLYHDYNGSSPNGVDIWMDINNYPGDPEDNRIYFGYDPMGDSTSESEYFDIEYDPVAHAWIKFQQINLGSHNVIGIFGSPNGTTWTPLYDHTAIAYDATVGNVTFDMYSWGFVEHFTGTSYGGVPPGGAVDASLIKMAFAPSGFKQVATVAQPLKMKMPDNTWRTFQGSTGIPLKQKQPDGSWLDVAWTTPGTAGGHWGPWITPSLGTPLTYTHTRVGRHGGNSHEYLSGVYEGAGTTPYGTGWDAGIVETTRLAAIADFHEDESSYDIAWETHYRSPGQAVPETPNNFDYRDAYDSQFFTRDSIVVNYTSIRNALNNTYKNSSTRQYESLHGTIVFEDDIWGNSFEVVMGVHGYARNFGQPVLGAISYLYNVTETVDMSISGLDAPDIELAHTGPNPGPHNGLMDVTWGDYVLSTADRSLTTTEYFNYFVLPVGDFLDYIASVDYIMEFGFVSNHLTEPFPASSPMTSPQNRWTGMGLSLLFSQNGLIRLQAPRYRNWIEDTP